MPDMWAEEERKRKAREAAARAATVAASQGSRDAAGKDFPTGYRPPSFDEAKKAAGVTTPVPRTGRVGMQREPVFSKNVEGLPTNVFVKMAEEARLKIQPQEKLNDPLQEFHLLRNQMGEEALQKRFKDMTMLAKSYLDPSFSPSTIWNLVRMPYSVGTTEYLLARGHQALFGVPEKGQQMAISRRSVVELTGGDQNAAAAVPAVAIIGQWPRFSSSKSGVLRSLMQSSKDYLNETANDRLARDSYRTAAESQVDVAAAAAREAATFDPIALMEAQDKGVDISTAEKRQEAQKIGRKIITDQTSWWEYPAFAAYFLTPFMGGGAGAMGGAAVDTAEGIQSALRIAWRAPDALKIIPKVGGLLARGANLAKVAGPIGEVYNEQFNHPGFKTGNRAADVIARGAQDVVTGAMLPLTAAGAIIRPGGNAGPQSLKQMDKAISDLDAGGFGGETVQDLQRMLGVVSQDKVTMQALASYLQQDEYDTAGNLIRPGFGKDIKDTSRMSPEMESMIYDAYGWYKRGEIENRRAIQEAYPQFIRLDLSAPSNDPEWMSAEGQAAKDMAAQQSAFRRNPAWAQFVSSLGVPLTKTGLNAYWGRLRSEGWAQILPKFFMDSAEKVVNVPFTVLAAVDLYTKQATDPRHRELQRNLYEALNSDGATVSFTRDVPPGGAWALWKAAEEHQGSQAVVAAQQALNKDTERLIDTEIGYGPNYVGTLARIGALVLGKDSTGIERWGTEHKDQVHAANLLFDAGFVMLQPTLDRVVGKKLTAVPVNEMSARSSSRIQSDTNYVAKRLLEGDRGLAYRRLGGTLDAAAVINTVLKDAADTLTPDAPIVQSITGRVIEAARSGDEGGVLAAVPELKDTAFAQQLIEHVQKGDDAEIGWGEKQIAHGQKASDPLARFKEQEAQAKANLNAKIAKQRAEATARADARLTAAEAKARERLDARLIAQETKLREASAAKASTARGGAPVAEASAPATGKTGVAEIDALTAELGGLTSEAAQASYLSIESKLASAAKRLANADSEAKSYSKLVETRDALAEQFKLAEKNLDNLDRLEVLQREHAAAPEGVVPAVAEEVSVATEAPAVVDIQLDREYVRLQGRVTAAEEALASAKTASAKAKAQGRIDRWTAARDERYAKLDPEGSRIAAEDKLLADNRAQATSALEQQLAAKRQEQMDTLDQTLAEREAKLNMDHDAKILVLKERAAGQWAEVSSKPVPEPFVARDRVATALVERQAKNADVVGLDALETRLHDAIVHAYVHGDILPWRKGFDIPRPSRFVERLEIGIRRINNPVARELLSRMATSLFLYAPLNEVSRDHPRAADRVFDFAAAVSGDFRYAADVRSRFVKGLSHQPSLDALADELAFRVNQAFDVSRSKGGGGKKAAFAPNPTGEGGLAGSYEVQGAAGGTRTMQPPPDTSFVDDTFPLGRWVTNAPRNVGEVTASPDGILQLWNHVSNAERAITRRLNGVSTPLRRGTVAAGFPLLAVKHTSTDPARNMVMLGPVGYFTTAKLTGVRGRIERFVDTLEADVANAYRARLHRVSQGEYHYYVMGDESRSGKWGEFRAYTDDGKPVRVNEAADAYRRIAQGQAFQAWARGGEAELTAWLNSTDGVRFLSQEGHYTRTREVNDGVAGMTTQAVHDVTVADYIRHYQNGWWAPLEQAAPRIMGRLKSMAANDEPLTVGAIRSHIQEVNKRARQRGGVANLENPVLSMPSEGGEGVIMHSMNRITGEAMSANRWARRGAFETLFDEYSRYLLKQNVEPNAAARSAMTMAELRSQRVHFDLSQMTNLEARNRWFMWFGTKHRLWSQWLARTAFTHPAAGVAVVEIKKWMEDANANEDPYDKHKIVFDAFGQKMKLNIATNFWFQDLPGESTMGALGERGLSTALGAAGLPTFTPSPVPFGYTTGRWDGAAIYVWEAIKAKDSGVLDADATLEDLQKYIDGWSPAEQKRWLPVIKEQRALATIKGEDIDSLEAFRRAIVARGKNEAWKLGRPLSITWESPAEEELQKQRDAAFLLTGYELSDYLEKHPAVAQSWNIYQNPAQQEREESAWKRFNQNRDGLTAELRKMSADGTIYDTGLVASTLSRYDGEIARWRQEGSPDYDPDFATVFGEAKEGKLREAISSLLPSADPENVLAGVRVPTKEEVTAYTQVLNNDLLKAASEQGFVPSRDANDEAYKRLKRDVVDVPLAHFQKYDPNEFTTQKTQRIAELLDRGTDAVGPTLAAQYLRGVENEQGIALLKRGSIGGKGKIHHALMGNLTPAEKKAMGWKSSFAAEFAWDQWSQEKHYLVEYMRKNGVVGNSKIGKAMWGKFDTWTEKLGTDNPDFGKELAFSKLDLHERMLELGVANPKTREGQGWGQFLSLITDMRADMKNVTYKSGFATVTGLTTLQGASAKPLNDEYLNKVVDMREKYPEWWREFTRTFSISSFGFYWQLESGADQELWAKEQVAQEQDALSQFYMFEDLSE